MIYIEENNTMKLSKIVLFALIIAIASTGLAMAGSAVKMNQQAAVSTLIQNNHRYDVRAAVRMTGYDDAGTVVGHLCKEVTLNSNRVTQVSYLWQAPGYETGLYWSPKVAVGGYCANQESGGDDYWHDDDDDHYDDDHYDDDHYDDDHDDDDHDDDDHDDYDYHH